MALDTPNLDDRDFARLLADCKNRILERCPDWDLSPANPGMVLVEVFAYLTDTMIYRLNRLPDKMYVELLRLLGVRLYPPTAAAARLRFSVDQPRDHRIEIPAGTRVTVSSWTRGSGPPVFRTQQDVFIEPGKDEVETLALHYEPVDAERLAISSGLPGQSYRVARPPIIADAGGFSSVLIGVETPGDELEDSRVAARRVGEKSYRIWREVKDFGLPHQDRHLYLVDRVSGTITFAPAARMTDESGRLEDVPKALAEIPLKGREILVWYLRGGGADGNVMSATLNTLKDQIPGVRVTNPAPATGGQEAEDTANALVRGPRELQLSQRAVTASDFEQFALRERGTVVRAKAFTKAAIWHYATPGTVDVNLVPFVPETARDGAPVTPALLHHFETDEARHRIEQQLDAIRPLGTACEVRWASYKTVRIKARIVVQPQEDPDAVAARLRQRFDDLVSPLPGSASMGWEFGRPLHVFQVYDVGSREPGVLRVEDVALMVDETPTAVESIAADVHQPGVWYSIGGTDLYRSVNDAEGWELIASLPGESMVRIRPCPGRPGMLALITHAALGEGDGGKQITGTRVRVSRDCGETWKVAGEFEFKIHDLDWLQQGSQQRLVLAGDGGLRELPVDPAGAPNVILVDQGVSDLRLYAVAVGRNHRDETHVVVAAQMLGGVYISPQAGRSGTFERVGLKGEDVRVLECQRDGDRTRFWAGSMVPGGQAGSGCHSWDFSEGTPTEGWRLWGEGWKAGGCHHIDFQGSSVYAGTARLGVLRLDRTITGATWYQPPFDCGLPLRDRGRLEPVRTVAVAGADGGAERILAGGPRGSYRSLNRGETWKSVSDPLHAEKVPLPPDWLFCPAEHDIEVVREHESG